MVHENTGNVEIPLQMGSSYSKTGSPSKNHDLRSTIVEEGSKQRYGKSHGKPRILLADQNAR